MKKDQIEKDFWWQIRSFNNGTLDLSDLLLEVYLQGYKEGLSNGED